MPQFEKHFTPGEANALLPELRRLLERVRSIRVHLAADWESAAPVLRAARQNGGGTESHALLTDIHQLNAAFHRLVGLGVQLKDLDRGLIDFPAWRGEREVFLCWHLGEDEVGYWHEVDAGFAGREPL